MSNSNDTEPTQGTSQPIVSSNMPSTRRVNKKLLLIFGTLLFVAAILVSGFLLLHRNKQSGEPYVLTISGAGKQYGLTQAQYASLIDQAGKQKVSADQAKSYIIKAHQYKIAAPSLHLDPTEEEIVSAAKAGAGYSGEGKLSEWQQLYGYLMGVEGNIKLSQVGGYNAAKFVYPFDRVYYNDSLTYSSPSQAAVVAAKKSALDQATAEREQLANGKITADKLIDKLTHSSERTWAGGNNSSKFLKISTGGLTYVEGDTLTYTEPDYVMVAITSLGNKPGVSTIKEVMATPYGAKKSEVIGYCFVSLTSVIPVNQNIDNDLKQALKTIEVVDHVQ